MQFKSGNNLKLRILTSLILVFILILMMINNYVLSYIVTVTGIFSLIEFFKINSIIFKNKKNKRFLSNLLFVIYIFIFTSAFITFSFYFHFKIFIFAILLACIASDIGGFVFGKIFKGPRLTSVSPKKTIAGALGSLIFSSVLLLSLFYYLTGNLNFLVMIIGLCISIGSQAGDLLFSYLKRMSKIKDTGNLLPGHGGILDRIDSILIGMPVGLFSIILFY